MSALQFPIPQVSPVWGDNVTVVIAGLSNTYSGYISTFEEYQVQRFEAAATAYGPHTLDAYVQEFMKLTQAMTEGKPTDHGPSPPDLGPKQWSFLPPVVIDSTPSGKRFGSIVTDVSTQGYKVGDKVTAVFQSACPRNDIRRGGSFLAVERQHGGSWETVYTDNDISTKYAWGRPHTLSSESTATISWQISKGTPDGVYRLRHFGDSKHLFDGTTPFEGASSPFTVGVAPSGLWQKAVNVLQNAFAAWPRSLRNIEA